MATISIQRAEKIARNINAMDVNYQYSDNGKDFKFWNELNKKLNAILSNLPDSDKKIITAMCEDKKAKYFGLI